MSHAFTSSADWPDYFHTTPPTAATSITSDHHQFAANSTAVPTQTTDPTPSGFSFNSTPSSVNNSTTPRANRVTKPARKRSRASRRTPTTLLSTDTSNFRAMVQQFTGGPSALGFGIGSGAIDHPLPRRVTDHPQLPFAFPSGYSFQFAQQQGEPARRMVEASSMTPNVKNDGVGNSFMY